MLKSTAQKGPNGVLVGRECMKKAIQAYEADREAGLA